MAVKEVGRAVVEVLVVAEAFYLLLQVAPGSHHHPRHNMLLRPLLLLQPLLTQNGATLIQPGNNNIKDW